LIPMRARYIAAPLVGECFANLECKVIDARLVKDYNLFILRPLKAWIHPKNPKTIHRHAYCKLVVHGRTILLKSKMR